MAKYRVTFACGHEEEKQLIAKQKDCDSYLAWAKASLLCRECFLKDQSAKSPRVYTRRVYAGAEIYFLEIYFLNSHNIREDLEARGYRSGEYPRGGPLGRPDLMTMKPTSEGWGRSWGSKGWGKIFSPGQEEDLAAEITWIRGQGWTIRAMCD